MTNLLDDVLILLRENSFAVSHNTLGTYRVKYAKGFIVFVA